MTHHPPTPDSAGVHTVPSSSHSCCPSIAESSEEKVEQDTKNINVRVQKEEKKQPKKQRERDRPTPV